MIVDPYPQLRITYELPSKSTAVLSDTDVLAGESVNVTITSGSSACHHDVVLTFGSHTTTTSLAVGDLDTSVSVGLSWLDAIPSTTSGIARVDVVTKAGTVNVGTNSYEFVVNVPSGVVPTIDSFIATNIYGDVPTAWGIYVQGYSKTT
jgi:hypothetical protein